MSARGCRSVAIGLAGLAGLSAVVALGAVACDEPRRGDLPAPSAPVPPKPAPLHDIDLPVPADFEEFAEERIGPANYQAELDALAEELAASR